MKLKEFNANIFSLYVKFSALHYLVKGDGFEEAHEKTQEMYEKFIEWYDLINERLVQLKECPLVNMTDIIRLSKIEELNSKEKRYSYFRVYDIMKNDINLLIKLGKECIGEIDKYDVVTNDILTEILRALEKEQWMLRSTSSSVLDENRLTAILF